jgi:hypothetical protein
MIGGASGNRAFAAERHPMTASFIDPDAHHKPRMPQPHGTQAA